jgi:hypothetical protein
MASGPAAAESPPEDGETTCSFEDDRTAATARWVAAADGGVTLEADVPAGRSWELGVEARFGPLRFAWTEAVAGQGARVSAALHPPAEAWLHPLAEDYVTALSVRLVGVGEGSAVGVSPPPAFLAWPAGANRPAVVWDRAGVDRLAPGGVVDAGVRAERARGAEDVDWFGPPLYGGAAALTPDPAPKGD